MIGGVGWRHDDVMGLNFYISGCDPSRRHHFLANGCCCACGVSAFEALNQKSNVRLISKEGMFAVFFKIGFLFNVCLYNLYIYILPFYSM